LKKYKEAIAVYKRAQKLGPNWDNLNFDLWCAGKKKKFIFPKKKKFIFSPKKKIYFLFST
jgi:hypothetical protein